MNQMNKHGDNVRANLAQFETDEIKYIATKLGLQNISHDQTQNWIEEICDRIENKSHLLSDCQKHFAKHLKLPEFIIERNSNGTICWVGETEKNNYVLLKIQKKEVSINTPIMFQIISRNNDSSGNPFRLGLVYDCSGLVVRVYEERSSMPNFAYTLRKRGLFELPTFHVAPKEYNQTKQTFKSILTRET